MVSVFLSYWRKLNRSGLWSVLVFAYAVSQSLVGLAQGPAGFTGGTAAPSGSALVRPTENHHVFIFCEYLHEETPAAVDITSRLNAAAGSAEAISAEENARVFVLRENCRVRQGDWELSARQMVIWKSLEPRQGKAVEKLLIYPEGEVRINPSQEVRPNEFIEIYTTAGITVEARHSHAGYVAQGDLDPLHKRALEHRQKIQQVAWNQPELLPQGAPLVGPAVDFDSLAPLPAPAAMRHVVISPRSFGIGYNAVSYKSEETSPPEQITVISQGVNIVVEGIQAIEGLPVGTVDFSADQAVIWTQANASGQFSAEIFQDANAPLQIYLEGNIEVRQGDNVLKAEKAFYDIRENRAVLHESELRVHIPSLQGDLKLRAEKIRQLSQDSFHAQNAWVTGSEFGVPTYRLEAGDIFLENRYDQGWLGKGNSQVDPQTGLSTAKPRPWITSLNNRFRVGETSVFTSPFMSGPAENPHIPLKSMTVGFDSVFGGQFRSRWDMSKLLGISLPGAEWDLNTNYYSKRGFLLGTEANYAGGGPLGAPGSYFGEVDTFWINDHGTDNLGLDRRSLAVSQDNRGRALLRHRHQWTDTLDFTGELGFLSDRNLLEQYNENEWDRGKDNETLLGLNYLNDNTAASLMTRFQLNDFEYETEWLPKADFTMLGEPLLWDRFVYSSRTSAGYGRLRPAEAPDDPNDLFVPLWYMPEAEGMVFSSRHELSMPFNVGPVKLDPYIMGEAAYWQDDGFTNSNLSRYYGAAGLRGSMMLWKVYPHVRSQILGLNGLAHKQVLGFDYSFADSSEDLSNIPQYNEFDENAQERFRTRLIFNTFGLMNSAALPPQYDPRFYAVRTGAGRNVTSPYHELVDDQHVLRLNWSHRLQTKVGPPERQREKDWMTLDLGLSYFPNADRDNFGESLGLFTTNYTWDVGARTKFLANSQFDFFDDAPSIWDVGVLSQRSERGSLYLGYRNLEAGDLQSRLLTASFSYVMSEKWVATMGTAYDIAENEDRGQSLTITGIRSDWLIHLGVSVDSSKGNVGFGFMIEPRLGPLTSSNKLGSLMGAQ